VDNRQRRQRPARPKPIVKETDGQPELRDRVVNIRRCAKVVKGGRRFSFSALVVVGDEKGSVGYGLGKANEVADAIAKGIEAAKKNMFRVPLRGTSIPHSIIGEYGSSRVLMKPAPPGTGVVAGGGVRAILEMAGVKDVYAKFIGSRNPLNGVRAGIEGLTRIKEIQDSVRFRRMA